MDKMKYKVTTRNISIGEALTLMVKEITAGKENLKQRQIDMAMRLETKEMETLFSDKSILTIANAIRIVSEIIVFGAGRVKNTDVFLATDDDFSKYTISTNK